MYFLIETKDQLKRLQDKNFDDVFIEVIPNNDLYHPALQEIFLIYIRPIDYKHGFILVVNHNEGQSLHKASVKAYIDGIDEKCTLNKKNLLYHFSKGDIYDLNFINFIKDNPIIYAEDYNTYIHNHFYSRFEHLSDINSLIPIVKHFEKYENLYDKIEPIISNFNSVDKEYNFYNNDLTNAFFNIEKQGIGISDIFDKSFEISDENRFIKNSKIYSQYNLYNTTLRPSNAFNSLNFAALNKTNGERSVFVPENDSLVEFDFKSFHLYILMHLVQFKLPEKSDIHTELGKIYFGKNTLTEEEYKEAKQKTFHILYTNEIKKYRHIEFFKLVEDYKNVMWSEYTKRGYIRVTPTKFTKLNSPTQLLPYILQNQETWYNVFKIEKISEYLKDKKTKLILYSYDSFLFDYSEQDGNECLTKIQEILEDGMFKCGIKYGENLHSIHTV